MSNAEWKIGHRGRAWEAGEALDRFYLAPEKIEMVAGKLFNNDDERLTMLALLIENVGVDAVIRIGDSAVWEAAIAELNQ